MKAVYYEQDDILEIRVSDKPVVSEVPRAARRAVGSRDIHLRPVLCPALAPRHRSASRAHGLPDSDDLLPLNEEVVDMMLMPGALQPSSGAMSVA